MPASAPAQGWSEPHISWTSSPARSTTVLPIRRRKLSPIPMGLTPAHLSRAIKRLVLAIRARKLSQGNIEFNITRVNWATASLRCSLCAPYRRSQSCQAVASAPPGPAEAWRRRATIWTWASVMSTTGITGTVTYGVQASLQDGPGLECFIERASRTLTSAVPPAVVFALVISIGLRSPLLFRSVIHRTADLSLPCCIRWWKTLMECSWSCFRCAALFRQLDFWKDSLHLKASWTKVSKAQFSQRSNRFVSSRRTSAPFVVRGFLCSISTWKTTTYLLFLSCNTLHPCQDVNKFSANWPSWTIISPGRKPAHLLPITMITVPHVGAFNTRTIFKLVTVDYLELTVDVESLRCRGRIDLCRRRNGDMDGTVDWNDSIDMNCTVDWIGSGDRNVRSDLRGVCTTTPQLWKTKCTPKASHMCRCHCTGNISGQQHVCSSGFSPISSAPEPTLTELEGRRSHPPCLESNDCLPSSWSRFDSRPTHSHKFFYFKTKNWRLKNWSNKQKLLVGLAGGTTVDSNQHRQGGLPNWARHDSDTAIQWVSLLRFFSRRVATINRVERRGKRLRVSSRRASTSTSSTCFASLRCFRQCCCFLLPCVAAHGAEKTGQKCCFRWTMDLFVKWRPAVLTGQLFAAPARIRRASIWSVYFGPPTVGIFSYILPFRRGGCEALRETSLGE